MESVDSTNNSGYLYTRTPLYIRIMIGLVIGVVIGVILLNATSDKENPPTWVHNSIVTMNEIAKLLLRLLNMIAPPLILVAVIRAIITADIMGRQAGRLMFLLILNTLVAIGFGLLVANVIKPGRGRDARACPACSHSPPVDQCRSPRAC